ncbi:glycosyltransferase family 4 protein [Smaragdicoccus niigatensis]|uniref:glycosyltransferase family 4 protein n=1 Tax=Smaragdicoccus niigatensis TaxID=359359 RepID=UPI00037AD513|nr:glycosyltransferase family 1 protein [Smaragdicoccus niigatensis]
MRSSNTDSNRSLQTATLISPVGQWRPSMVRLADELTAGLEGRGITVQRPTPPTSNWAGRFAFYPVSAARAKADIYHVADHSLGHTAAFLPKRRTIISCHDLFLLRAKELFPDEKIPPRHLAQFKFSISYLRKAAAVVALTAATKADIVRLLDVDPERIDVAHVGVHERFRQFSEDKRAEIRSRLGEHGPLIVHVGNSPYKNMTGIVDALARVRRQGVEARLLHVGDPISPALTESFGVTDHIRELGRISDDELVEILNAADAMIFPSLWEGMGWPPLEAMACGLPVVTSNIAPVVEVAGDAALTADPTDHAALADHLGGLLTDSGLADRMRSAGFVQVKQFTWARTVDKYLSVYQRVWEAR